MRTLLTPSRQLENTTWPPRKVISYVTNVCYFLTPLPPGITVPPPEPSVPNPDYVQCPYCKRRFQEHAAERHIPFCKEQNARLERKTPSASGNSALNKRLKYRPPAPRKKSGVENRPTYHTPGASIVQKKTNFSGTYTLDENDDYKSSGTQ